MAKSMDQLYNERMKRYITAMRNEKPDMIPIRPFVAEFTAKYAGYTCQEVVHDNSCPTLYFSVRQPDWKGF